MKTDYKFWYVKRYDPADVVIAEVAVRFYEGDIITSTKNKMDTSDGIIKTTEVTEYTRTRRLTPSDMPHLEQAQIKMDGRGECCFIFTDKDFGYTTDLDDVRLFLNKKLARDASRSAIAVQATTEMSSLKAQSIK